MKALHPNSFIIFALILCTFLIFFAAGPPGSPPANDDFADAIELADVDDWTSGNAAYTTVDATDDQSAGDCWDADPDNNVWFKFTAISKKIIVEVQRGGAKGDIEKINLAIWESDGSTQLACERYSNKFDEVSLFSADLTSGNIYYISVDNKKNSDGTFTLCVNNNIPNAPYYSVSDGEWTSKGSWATSKGGPASSFVPADGDTAYITGSEITLTKNITIENLIIDVESDRTKLTIDDARLTINESIALTNNGINQNAEIKIENNGTLDVASDIIMTRNGGNNKFKFVVKDASTLFVGRDFILDSDAGTTKSTKFKVDNTASATITRDLILDYSGGESIIVTVNDDGVLTVGGDINYSSTAAGNTEIELNNSGALTIAGNFVRGTPTYGILDCNASSTLTFNGSGAAQALCTIAGDGGDGFSYQNVTINNSFGSSPQITLNGAVTINGNLTLTDGIIQSTAVNLLALESGATTSGGSTASFVEGPIKKTGNSSFTFPTGDGNVYAPVGISAPGLITAEYICEYFFGAPSNPSNLGDGVENISGVEYWDVHRENGTSPDDDIFVTFFWEDGVRSEISSLDNLIVVHYDGLVWENMGKGSTTGDASSGSITSNIKFSSFSGGGSGEGDSGLPIELLSFEAEHNNTQIDLNWITSSEINNDFFTIERSINGIDFETITTVKGAGNSSNNLSYSTIDFDPKDGISYYRLKQTDYDGKFEHSQLISVSVVNENDACKMTVKPNPCIGKCFVDLTNCDELNNEIIFAIFDAMGNTIMTAAPNNTNDGNATFSFDVNNNLRPGVYIVRGGSRDKKMEKKIVIDNG